MPAAPARAAAASAIVSGRAEGGPVGASGGGSVDVRVSVTLALSVEGLTIRAALILGLAIAALLLTGWRKPARAETRSPRGTFGKPASGIVVDHFDTPQYRRPGIVRRVLALLASGGIGVLTGVLAAILLSFSVAMAVIWMTKPARAMSARDRRVDVIVAGHTGDTGVARRHLTDPNASVRAAAVHALERAGALTDAELDAAAGDGDPAVRRVAAELIGRRPVLDLGTLLNDADPTVVEVAAWAAGEQERVSDAVLDRLIRLGTDAEQPLVREAAAAALGAIGDQRGLPTVLAACTDKPHVRRRAVLALAPFEGVEVDAAIERALTDRDWQVRQAAEDLRRAEGEIGIDPT